MNILQIVPNRGWGGGEKCVLELSEALTERGNNIIVVRPACPVLKEKFKDLNTIELNLSSLLNPFALAKLSAIIKQNRIEIVHCHIFRHAFAALLAKQLWGCNTHIVLTRHLCKRGKTSLPYRWLYAKIDQLAFVSGVAMEKFRSTNPPIAPEKTRVVHNGIKTGEPLPTAPQNSICTIGIIGRVTQEKGVKELIEALHLCNDKTQNDFRLKIAGTGDPAYITMLEELIERYNLTDKVEFVGFIEQVLPFIGGVDIVATPSLAVEAFPLTTLEAMYCGKAILASNGGQREMIATGKQGIIIESISGESIAEGLMELIDNKPLRERLGAAAKERFQSEFIFERYIDKYIDLYHSTLGV